MISLIKFTLYALLLIALVLQSITYAEQIDYTTQDDVEINIFGNSVQLNTPAIIYKDYLYVPLQDIYQVMNLDLTYERKHNEYRVKRYIDNRSAILGPDSTEIALNGQQINISHPCIIAYKTLYIPLGDFCWWFGHQMRHDNKGHYIVSHRITDIKINASGSQIQIVGASPVDAKCWVYPENKQIIIDINDAVWTGVNKGIEPDQKSNVEIIWIGQNRTDPDVVRVTVQLKKYFKHLLEPDYERNILGLSVALKATDKLVQQPVVEKAILEENQPKLKKTELIISSGRYPESSRDIIWLPDLQKINEISYLVRSKKLLTEKPRYGGDILLFPAEKILTELGYSFFYREKEQMVVISRGEEKQYTLEVGSSMVDIKEGDRIRSIDLNAETQQISGTIYLPLLPFFKCIGESARYDEQKQSVIIDPVIREILVEKHGNLNQLRVIANGPIQAGVMIELNNPPRMFFDIGQSTLDLPIQQMSVNIGSILSVRSARYERSQVRIAVDVRSTRDCYLWQGERANEVYLTFLPWIDQIKVEEATNYWKMLIQNSNTNYRLEELEHPHRLVIDLPDVLIKKENVQLVRKNIVRHVELVQQTINPFLGRVVLDLEGEVTYNVRWKGGQLEVMIERSKETEPDVPAQPMQKAIDNLIPAESEEPDKIGVNPKDFSWLRNKRIIIEAGHGGMDPGAIGKSGLQEKLPALQTALKIKKLFQEAGARAFMVIEKDQFMSLEDRVGYANNNRGDVFISVHYNSHLLRTMNGIETFYYKESDFPLGKAVHAAMVKSTGRPDHLLRRGQLYVLNHTQMPAICIEPGYISNPEEEDLIQSSTYQDKVAVGLFLGVAEYYRNK